MGSQLQELTAAGQSIWLDNIRRGMFASGELQRLIDLGLRGMTSNPTIFEKAIGGSGEYDAQLRSLAGSGLDADGLFEALAIEDIRNALDLFRPLYDASGATDGFVSLEVSPLLASDTAGTISAAKRLWAAVDRPNLMIKIPATPEGLPAVSEAIAAGINVNVTLIFSIESYEAVAEAHIAGLERRLSRGEPLDRVASVASVFVSRIDTAVDKLLADRVAAGKPVAGLLGKTGVANLKLTYERYRALYGSPRFAALEAAGAHAQRPLWASTGTKNPAYSDLLYVENVVAQNTVNTLPPATLDALLAHGRIRPDAIGEDLAGAKETLAQLAAAGISLHEITQRLQDDGVTSFADSYTAMLEAIERKRDLLAGSAAQVAIDLGKAEAGPDAALAALAQGDFLRKLWAKDPAPWSADSHHAAIVAHSLGWLDFPERVLAAVGDLVAFARESAAVFEHVVVLGMGGSSLAPDVLRATFGRTQGFPQLHVLDSSDPSQILTLEGSIDIARTLFIVASKSGTTIEPDAFFRYFFERVQRAVGAADAGSHFIAITDPGTKLVADAQANGFRRIFLNDPTIGGRYSALSYFGMVPAALAGYDVARLLDRGIDVLRGNGKNVAERAADGVRFGATLGALAKAGRDKLTIVTHPRVAAFGAWAEQLVAESTGKLGLGIIPVEGESLAEPALYGDDRVFVYVGAGLGRDAENEARLLALAEAGAPIVRLALHDAYDIGAQFALWEIATATAGAVLGIDAFDQPNVQESKDNTKRLLAEFAAGGSFQEPQSALSTPHAAVIPLSGSRDRALGSSLASALGAIFGQVRTGDYVAITAYIEMTAEHQAALQELRVRLRDALHVATTVGFGPRFLHSTGQLHKGGPPTGVFLQLTADPPLALPIPGMADFRTLERAQALGDFEALDSRGRRGARIHLSGALEEALAALGTSLEEALSATRA
jgi:transaldolase/glucose-6-phosphate isomerase